MSSVCLVVGGKLVCVFAEKCGGSGGSSGGLGCLLEVFRVTVVGWKCDVER